jgi:protein-L-isoaspartate(D-aspartate) O-methyltransferase
MDIKQARKNTIDSQIRPWGGLNYVANNALRGIPREIFVPQAYQNLAFADMEIPLSNSAKMLPPKLEGRLLDVLDIKPHEKVLEIGTGSGYLTAVIAQLCQKVTSIEIDVALSESAAQKLQILDINNVDLKVGDASKGWDEKDEVFFDVVVVGASVPKITGRYFHLLKVGGRIFVIEGAGSAMSAKLITRLSESEWRTESLFEIHLDTMLGLSPAKAFSF